MRGPASKANLGGNGGEGGNNDGVNTAEMNEAFKSLKDANHNDRMGFVRKVYVILFF